MSGFHIGQLVICVDDSGWAKSRAYWHLPRRGVVYTIRDIGPSYYWNENFTCVRVSELRNPPVWPLHGEPNFRAARFRPVDPKAIAVFREALAPVPRVKSDA